MSEFTALLTDLIVRIDTTVEPASIDSLTTATDPDRDQVVHGLWTTAPDATTLSVMVGIYDHFRSEHHLNAISSATHEQVADYLRDSPDDAAEHLRRNTVTAAILATNTHNPDVDLSAVHGHDMPDITVITSRISRSWDARTAKATAGKGKSSPKAKAMQRPSTNDEVTLVRLAASSPVHPDPTWCAATVAAATTGAAPAEIPNIRRVDVHTDRDQPLLDLSGRHVQDPSHGWHLAARSNLLDPWAATQLAQHLQHSTENGRVHEHLNVLYTGAKGSDSESARISSDRMISRAVATAGFRVNDQITSGGLSLWRATHTALHHGLDAGALEHGTDAYNLLRKLTHAHDRAYKSR